MLNQSAKTVIFSLVFSSGIFAQNYQVKDLGNLDGTNWCAGWSVNEHGEVAGECTSGGSDPKAFLYLPNDSYGLRAGMHLLSPSSNTFWSFGYDINDHGQAVGGAYSVSSGMFGYSCEADACSEIAALTSASSINRYGQIAGYGGGAEGEGVVPMVFDSRTGKSISLGSFGGTFGVAQGISDSGLVVGYSKFPGNTKSHAFLFRLSSPGLIDLGGLIPENSSAANAVNSRGEIVGWAYNAGWKMRAVRWGPNSVSTTYAQDLGVLPGDQQSLAYDINDQGTIVGRSESTTGTRGVVVRNGIMHDLNDLLFASAQEEWIIEEALGINNRGQIVGMALSLLDGNLRAVLLDPISDQDHF